MGDIIKIVSLDGSRKLYNAIESPKPLSTLAKKFSTVNEGFVKGRDLSHNITPYTEIEARLDIHYQPVQAIDMAHLLLQMEGDINPKQNTHFLLQRYIEASLYQRLIDKRGSIEVTV